MRAPSELSDLAAETVPLAVSIFLPTDVRGSEVRQGPIRLKNLVSRAREIMSSSGIDDGEADALLGPLTDLVDDYQFWQHQDQGLAIFLGGDTLRSFSVPLPLPEQVVVGSCFYLRPLLPLLTADGAFRVLTLTAKGVQLYNGSRFTLSEDDSIDLPNGVDDIAAESDYENPVQAPPVARPNTGRVNISNAQVYGDGPPDWRKAQLIDFAHRLAVAIDAATGSQRLPLVLVAEAELGGHFRKASKLGSLLAGFLETNPDALTPSQLHEATYQMVRPRLDERRRGAIEQFAGMRGRNDPRAVTRVVDVVRASFRGQIDTIFLRMESSVLGHYDADSDELSVDRVGGRDESSTDPGALIDKEDLYERASMLTLESGGDVHVLDATDLPEVEYGAALLRY